MRINNRYKLIAYLAAVQAACLCWGVALFDGWLTASIRDTVHDQVLADNVEVARQMTRLIGEMELSDIRHDRTSWDRLQRVVRDIRLPNQGFVCVVDAGDGRTLCHPGLNEPPTPAEILRAESQAAATTVTTTAKAAMAKPPMEKPSMSKPPMDKPLMSEAPMEKAMPKKPANVDGGVVGEGDALQIIAAAAIPSLNARVLVHQFGAGIDKAIDKVTAPIEPIGFAVAMALVAVTTVALAGVLRFYDNRLARLNEELEDRVEHRTRALRKTRDAVIFGLAKLAESRDTDTGEHLERIRTYVTLLARNLTDDLPALDARQVEAMALASSLHDIGKVGIPDAVLLKPGRLDPDERANMERHASIGGECLEAIGSRLGEDDFLQLAKEIAYGHHEKWDGSGYPAGTAGEMIPLSARIVALADVYDALRSRRPYKEPMPHAKARQILLDGRGSHFDPVVVEAFLACEAEFEDVADRSNEASARDHAEAPREDELSLA